MLLSFLTFPQLHVHIYLIRASGMVMRKNWELGVFGEKSVAQLIEWSDDGVFWIIITIFFFFEIIRSKQASEYFYVLDKI